MRLLLDAALLARPHDAAGAGGCAACGVGLFVMVGIFVAAFIFNVALLVWVARDAKARGLDSSVIWMLLVLFTGLLGFVIYIFSRPQGQLVRCGACGNNRLQASVKCSTCGNATGPASAPAAPPYGYGAPPGPPPGSWSS